MVKRKSSFFQRFSIAVSVCFLLSALFPSQPRAMTHKEERELGEKVLQEVRRVWPLIQDPAVNEYVNNIGKRILKTMETQPFEYEFYVLNTPDINAFAVPGGKVFLNSGMILLVDKEDELAGVMAHEIGHVVARHIAKQSEQGLKMGLATLGALLAGILLGPQAAAAIVTTTTAATGTPRPLPGRACSTERVSRPGATGSRALRRPRPMRAGPSSSRARRFPGVCPRRLPG